MVSEGKEVGLTRREQHFSIVTSDKCSRITTNVGKDVRRKQERASETRGPEPVHMLEIFTCSHNDLFLQTDLLC